MIIYYIILYYLRAEVESKLVVVETAFLKHSYQIDEIQEKSGGMQTTGGIHG
jgi:hypothetical protein